MLELLFVPTADAFGYAPVTLPLLIEALLWMKSKQLDLANSPGLLEFVWNLFSHRKSSMTRRTTTSSQIGGYKRILFAAIIISIRSVYPSNSFALRPTSTWSESRQSGVPQLRCVGTEKVDCTVRGGPPPVFFLRSISRGPGLIEEAGTSKFLTRMILTSFSARCRTGFDHLKTMAALPPCFGRSSIFIARLPSFLGRENWPRTSATRLSRP